MHTKKNQPYSRRTFLTQSLMAGAGVGLAGLSIPLTATASGVRAVDKKIGIIGLDTTHSEVFTKLINTGDLSSMGYKVVAAYPHGSKDLESAFKIKEKVLPAVQAMNIEIVESIDALIQKVDVVLLETIDGRVHYEQALPVLKARKRMFIDKPMGATGSDVHKIFEASRKFNSPVFSSSALRFDDTVQKVVKGSIGKVMGADVYAPAGFEKGHLDLAWYGIHGVEMLFTVMGTGCKKVSRAYNADTDIVTGIWEDGRMATLRGIRKGMAKIAGTAFGEKGIAPLGPFGSYVPLVKQILQFFDAGVVPVSEKETSEIFAFMEAVDKSKKENGKVVHL